MDYVLNYRLFPTTRQRELLDWVRDTVRQVYNHALHRFNRIPENVGTVKQRQTVAEVHKRMRNKKSDFKHKVAAFYTREYDAVFIENLNVKSMLEGCRNGRNAAEVGWRDFITILKHHGNKRGCHVIEIDPEDTPVEIATATEPEESAAVSASRVVETGSPCLKEATQSVAE
jgi:IS605 OrfB family transposase